MSFLTAYHSSSSELDSKSTSPVLNSISSLHQQTINAPLVRRWCCCTSNRNGGMVIGITELVIALLLFVSEVQQLQKRPVNSATGEHSQAAFWIALALLTIGGVCILVGSWKRESKLLVVWIALAILEIVLFTTQAVMMVVNNSIAHAVGYIIVFVLIRLWLLMVAVGAREEMLLFPMIFPLTSSMPTTRSASCVTVERAVLNSHL